MIFISVQLPCSSVECVHANRPEEHVAISTHMTWWRTEENTPTSASLCRTASSASVNTFTTTLLQEEVMCCKPCKVRRRPLVKLQCFKIVTHWLPVVEGFITVRDVAEQSCTETCRQQAFKCSGAFRGPHLTSPTNWPTKHKKNA